MSRTITLYLAIAALTASLRSASAQDMVPFEPIICYHHDYTASAFVAAPEFFLDGTALPLSEFRFFYGDSIPALPKAAIEYAASVWETYLVSEVPIEVSVAWQPFEEENVLASAGPTNILRDFPGAVDPEVWYPVALAESILGENFNDDAPDIRVVINSEANWYFGIDGNTPPGQIDMASVIMHELGHGLGFVSSSDVVEDRLGALGFNGRPITYDLFLTTDGVNINDETLFPSPSEELLNVFTSNELFFDSELAAEFNGGQNPMLFAPFDYEEGSSISHLDEIAFPNGAPNALMSPFIARGEALHDPGPIAVAMLQTMGWETRDQITNLAEPEPVVLELFPNPAVESVQLRLSTAWQRSATQLSLLDTRGNVLQQQRLPPGPELHRINLRHLPAGQYWLQLEGAGKVAHRTVVVSR